MPARRSRLGIFLEVLSAVGEGVEKPTRIMYKVGLSWVRTIGVLSSLVRQGLIRVREVEENKRSWKRYEVTEKGFRALKYFEEADEFIRII